jgi:lipoate-protein ligase A
MARDMSILEAVSEGLSPSVLRLYGWAPPCLSLGRHQTPAAANLDFCRSEGIDVVQRPTGGRALLHHLELTYAVCAPIGRPPLPHALQEAYRTICNALVRTARSLGVAAELTPGEVNLHLPGPRTSVPCFEAPAGGEVVVRGCKLVGSAIRAHRGAILQHGAILTDWHGGLQAGAMGLEDDSFLRTQITTFRRELGRQVSRTEIEESLVDAFTSELDIELEPGQPGGFEGAREEELIDSFTVAR